MDKIIWSDGHTTTISSEEAFRRQYEFYTDDGSEWRMRIGDAEFAWARTSSSISGRTFSSRERLVVRIYSGSHILISLLASS